MKLRPILPALLLAAAPAAAHAQVQPLAGSTVAPQDSSEVVCEKQQVIGSRLAVKKICMTRSQWAEARRQDRDAVEKVQQQRAVIGESASGPCIASGGSHC